MSPAPKVAPATNPATSSTHHTLAIAEAEFVDELDRTSVDAVIAGHSGLLFSRIIGDRLWHNPGSLGLPANDGTPRGWYSIVATAGKAVRLSHFGFGYDHRKAAAKMRAAGLPEGYADCLETGLWPFLDVLPATERAAAGQALGEHVVDWVSPLVCA